MNFTGDTSGLSGALALAVLMSLKAFFFFLFQPPGRSTIEHNEEVISEKDPPHS